MKFGKKVFSLQLTSFFLGVWLAKIHIIRPVRSALKPFVKLILVEEAFVVCFVSELWVSSKVATSKFCSCLAVNTGSRTISLLDCIWEALKRLRFEKLKYLCLFVPSSLVQASIFSLFFSLMKVEHWIKLNSQTWRKNLAAAGIEPMISVMQQQSATTSAMMLRKEVTYLVAAWVREVF